MRAVATAAPQRGGCGEADVSAEHNFEELPGALSGYSLLHLSQPLKTFAFFFNCESLFSILLGFIVILSVIPYLVYVSYSTLLPLNSA